MKKKQSKSRIMNMEKAKVLHDWMLENEALVTTSRHSVTVKEAAEILLQRINTPTKVKYWTDDFAKQPDYWYISCILVGFTVPKKEAPL